MNAFDKFSLLSGFSKPNKAKYEIVGIGILKGLSLALCGMDCIELNFIRHVRKNEKVLKVTENAKFACGKKNYYFQNFSSN